MGESPLLTIAPQLVGVSDLPIFNSSFYDTKKAKSPYERKQ